MLVASCSSGLLLFFISLAGVVSNTTWIGTVAQDTFGLFSVTDFLFVVVVCFLYPNERSSGLSRVLGIVDRTMFWMCSIICIDI